MTLLTIILVFLAVAWLGVVLGLYLLQNRLLYFPTREIFATPAQRGLRFEEIELVADDGVKLAGWFVPSPSARGTVLFLHGNGGNISHTVEAVESFARLGMNVLSFDYRGYGRSQGKPSGDGIMRDAEAAWRHLRQERAIAASSIVIVGRSLGGGPAAALAAKYRPAGLILESTYTSIPERAGELFPVFPTRWFVRTRFNTRASLAHVMCPTMIVHSTEDETIPYHHSLRLFEAASEPKELVTLSHGHNECFALSGLVYTSALDRFITDVLGSPQSVPSPQ